jgi:hypothetical protein
VQVDSPVYRHAAHHDKRKEPKRSRRKAEGESREKKERSLAVACASN